MAECFNTSWGKVYESVKAQVEYGLEHRQMDDIEAIGVDEWMWQKGHKYLTLVYQLDEGKRRLLYITRNRTKESLDSFFSMLGKARYESIKVVCSDMWKPFLSVIKQRLPKALNILDRFHVVAKLNEAVDDVRKSEAKQMQSEGFEPVLKGAKYCFLKNKCNLTDFQATRLKQLLKIDLKSVKAYLLKEAFQAFWQYKSPIWACNFLSKWVKEAEQSNLKPMQKFAKTITKHQSLLMNWFKAKKRFSSGIVEGLKGRRLPRVMAQLIQ